MTIKFRPAILGITFIGTLFTACKDNKTKTAPAVEVAHASTDKPFAGRIAYVNIDSFEAHYEYLKTKRDAFEKKQKSIEDELSRTERQLQSEAEAFQKKAQSGGYTQAEGEKAQSRLMQQGQALERKRQSYTEQLMKEQQEFNDNLRKTLNTFLKKYNADKGYDYILSYAEGNAILLANDALDITNDVIEGMNNDKVTIEEPTNTVDTTKK